jgi:hypothetical protein
MACCSNKCRTDLYKKRLTKTIYKKQEREEEYLKNPLICQSCNTSLTYKQSIQWNKTAKRKNPERTIACSHGCSRKNIHKAKGVKKELEYLKNPLVCECCENTLTYKQSIRRKSTQRENPDSKIFCSTLCSRRFASKITRPKVEILCEEKINSLYKNYGFIFNNIETIKYELDIYSPVLKLAIELNGPTHYKDIFSNPKKFQRRLEIDKEKKILCKKLGIELVSLDISKRTKNYNQDILDRVIKVIEERVQKCGDALI